MFDLAVTFLAARKQQAYAEQMQGMYTLTRGLAGAFFLAAESWIGWYIGALPTAANRPGSPEETTAVLAGAWALLVVCTLLPLAGIYGRRVNLGSTAFLLPTLIVIIVGALGGNKFDYRPEPWIGVAAACSMAISLYILRPAVNGLFEAYARGVYRGLAATSDGPAESATRS